MLSLRYVAFLLRALALEDDALEFFKDNELLVRVVNLGVTLFLGDEEACLLETLQLTLNVTRIFLNKLSKASDVSLEIWILRINYNDFATNP